MRVDLEPSYLLHAQKISDSRLRLECLTSTYGAMSFIARAPSRKKSPFLLFNRALISWVGKGGLKTLTLFEPAAVPAQLLGNNLYCGFYLNEIACRLLPKGEQVSALFELYSTLIQRWQGLPLALEMLEPDLRTFELMLLQELGYAVDFKADVSGVPIDANKIYKLSSTEGFLDVAISQEANVNQEYLAKHGLYLGDHIIAVSECRIEGAARISAKRMTRQLLAPLLGRKPLKSRELFIKPTSQDSL